MTERSWWRLGIVAIVASALIGIASVIDIPYLNHVVRPRVECQDSARCRAFVDAEIAKALKAERGHTRRTLHKVLAAGSGARGGGPTNGAPPSSPSGGGRPAPSPSPHQPAPRPPHRPPPGGGGRPPKPGLLDPILDPVCSLTPLGIRVCTTR